MASASYHISNLLEKMTSSDKDFRFMATNDLMTELQKDSIKLDDDSERKVVRMILKLLEDKNGEVQNLAAGSELVGRPGRHGAGRDAANDAAESGGKNKADVSLCSTSWAGA
uniref:Cullin-associated and neddylation-dissociated 1 n=1 Tax=Xiphophorus maculatus TaxID=8083 RepID=A0A3B5PNJ8_XIPMA